VNKRLQRDGFVFVLVRAGRTDLTERTPEKDSRSQLSIFVALHVSVGTLSRRGKSLPRDVRKIWDRSLRSAGT
jgi:hypothetical protein